MDKINLEQINFIMSQHLCECFIDTLQNILYYSDYFRDIFANLAKYFFEKYDNKILDFDDLMLKELTQKLDLSTELIQDNPSNIHQFFVNIVNKHI